MTRMRRAFTIACAIALVGVTSCAGSNSAASVAAAQSTSSTNVATTADPPRASVAPVGGSDFPDVVAAEAHREDNGSWRFDVTVSSPYDSPDRYADAWRILGPDGTEFGVRILTHDHATEQPFTRSRGGVEIPDDVKAVTIEGRDLTNGWGGGTLELELP